MEIESERENKWRYVWAEESYLCDCGLFCGLGY